MLKLYYATCTLIPGFWSNDIVLAQRIDRGPRSGPSRWLVLSRDGLTTMRLFAGDLVELA